MNHIQFFRLAVTLEFSERDDDCDVDNNHYQPSTTETTNQFQPSTSGASQIFQRQVRAYFWRDDLRDGSKKRPKDGDHRKCQ